MMFAAALAVGLASPKFSAPSVQVSNSGVISYLHPVAFAAAPTGSRLVACMEDGAVCIIDGKSHQVVRQMTKHLQPAMAAAWSKDGLYVATGDETARIFIESPLSGEKIREYRTHTKGIQKLSFNVTREYLVSTGKDDQINIYDLSSSSNKEARKILGKGANFYGATCSTKLPFTLSTGILGPGGRCYDISSGKMIGFLTTGEDQGVFDVCYNPAGTREVTAGKCGDADVFDAVAMKKLGALKGHQDFVIYAAYSPNGALIATSSSDRTVRVWNASTFEKIAEIPQQSAVGSPLCFTADGSTLVTVNDSNAIQFNTLSPSQAATEKASAPTKATKKGKKAKKRKRH